MIITNFKLLNTVFDLVGLCVTIELRNSPTGINVIYNVFYLFNNGCFFFGINNKRATVGYKTSIRIIIQKFMSLEGQLNKTNEKLQLSL